MSEKSIFRVLTIFLFIVLLSTGIFPAQHGVFANSSLVLDTDGVITGTTYTADGVTPLPHIAISIQSLDRSYSEGACTDGNGQYELQNVPFDIPLRVRADAYLDAWCNAGANYIREYWGETLNDGPTLLTVTSASPLLTDIDFAMDLDNGSLPNPWLRVWYKDGVVEADGWSQGTHLKLKIEDTSTLQSPDYSAEMDVTANDGSPTFFSLEGQFEIKPNMLVSISGAYMTRIIYVNPLTITSIDPNLDTITGTTKPDLWMWMWFEPSCCRPIDSDENGVWTVDYSVPGPNDEPVADIVLGSTGAIHVPSGDGSTSIEWAFPDPNIDAWYLDGFVEALDWPVGTPLTLKIEDPTTLLSPDYEANLDVTGSAPTLTTFNLTDGFEMKPGMIVSISGSTMYRKIVIDPLIITNIDQDLDTITGTTAPNNWLWIYFEPSCTPTCRSTVADGNGIWSFDFSVPGSEGQPVADVGPGSTGAVHVPSGDGRTSVMWFIPIATTFKSIGLQDGWILESSETSNKGGAMNKTTTLLYVGDNAQDKQYRSILSFNTAGLPDNAKVTKVQLKIKVQGFVGGNMFTPTKTLGNLLMDIRKPYFGSTANLVVDDFQAAADSNGVGVLSSVPGTGWRTVTLKSDAYKFINLASSTQYRLRFQKDDNDDLGADYLKIYSGDAPAASRPQLIVEYYIP